VRLRVADPAMWIRQADTGKAISTTYAENGVAVNPASNDRLSGLERVQEFLNDAEDAVPYLQVFNPCTELIKNLPALVYDQHQVEDVDTDGPDDEYDALRYGLMAAHWLVGSGPMRSSDVRLGGGFTQSGPAADFERMRPPMPARVRR